MLGVGLTLDELTADEQGQEITGRGSGMTGLKSGIWRITHESESWKGCTETDGLDVW